MAFIVFSSWRSVVVHALHVLIFPDACFVSFRMFLLFLLCASIIFSRRAWMNLPRSVSCASLQRVLCLSFRCYLCTQHGPADRVLLTRHFHHDSEHSRIAHTTRLLLLCTGIRMKEREREIITFKTPTCRTRNEQDVMPICLDACARTALRACFYLLPRPFRVLLFWRQNSCIECVIHLLPFHDHGF